MADLIIRNGRLVDGSGGPERMADVVVDGGRVNAVVDAGAAPTDGAGEVIDADGAVVTPGFVDIHTHYDGQATWDNHLAPSSWHGVTTVVMGNCGVGIRPGASRRPRRADPAHGGRRGHPGRRAHEGVSFEWEPSPSTWTPSTGPHDIDVAAQVPHGAAPPLRDGRARRAAGRRPPPRRSRRWAASCPTRSGRCAGLHHVADAQPSHQHR